MNKILMQLRSGGLPIENPVAVALAPIVRRAVESRRVYEPKPRLMADAADILVVASPERLERVVGHLVQNALEATPADGQVDIIVGRKGAEAYVEVRDTGRGMASEFLVQQFVQAVREHEVERHGHWNLRKPRVRS